MEQNFKQLGEEFAKVYYQTYDSNRQGLKALYEAQSLLTFEGDGIQGADMIGAKLTSLPFQQVQHQVAKCDCHPVPGSPDKILISVTGTMIVNGNQNVKF